MLLTFLIIRGTSVLESIPVGTGNVADAHTDPCLQFSINLSKDASVCDSKFTFCNSETSDIYIPPGFLGIHLSP